MMKSLILALTLAACAFAQVAPQAPPAPQQIQRVFELKYVGPNEVKTLLAAFPVVVSPAPSLGMISVNGTKEVVDTIAEVLKKIDVPPPPQVPPARKNIEFTGYMVMASASSSETAEPAELTAVIKQLRALFPYRSYRVVETVFLRTRDGHGGDTKGYIADNPRKLYALNFRSATISSDKLIRLDRLQLDILPDHRGLGTDIDIREGQKVVVGKSNLVGDDALILVLSAKVIE